MWGGQGLRQNHFPFAAKSSGNDRQPSLPSLGISGHVTKDVHGGSQTLTIKLIAVALGAGLVLAVFTDLLLDVALVFGSLIS